MSEASTESLKPVVTPQDHALFILVTLLYWITLYIYVPILSPYLESMGVTYTFVGIVLGSYGFMQILVRLPLGILSDRNGARKPFILIGMLTGALSCLCFALGSGPGWALAARAISGISASTWVAFTVMYAGYFPRHETTRAMGMISFITVAGQLIGMGASGFLAESFSWKATFWMGSVMGLAGGLMALFIREDRGLNRPGTNMRYADLIPVMRTPVLFKVSLLSILGHSVLFITMFGFTPSYALTIGADKSGLSLLVFAFMIPHAAAAILTGRFFASRFGAWRIVTLGFAGSALCTLAIPFVQTFEWLLVTQALNGFAQGLHLPLLLGLAIEKIDNRRRATAMGFYQAVYAVGMFAGPFLAGAINSSFTLAGGFYFGGVIAAIAVGLAIYWGRSEMNHDSIH